MGMGLEVVTHRARRDGSKEQSWHGVERGRELLKPRGLGLVEERKGGVVVLAIPGSVPRAGSSSSQSPLLAESSDEPEHIKNKGPRD